MRKLIFFIAAIFTGIAGYAQQDTLITINGDILTGKIILGNIGHFSIEIGVGFTTSDSYKGVGPIGDISFGFAL